MTKFSFFKTNKDKQPSGSLTLAQLIDGIKSGTWRKEVERVRKATDKAQYKRFKYALPAVTVSALMNSRAKDFGDKVKEPSGLIAIDIDKKDNPKLRVSDLVDKECLAQFVSPGGGGLKIIYACKPTRDPAVHRRIYDAVIDRLQGLGVAIKVDPIVKSLYSFQFVSYDPDTFFNPKSKLVIKPLPPVVRKTVDKKGVEPLLVELGEYIKYLKGKDATATYEDWLNVLFGLAYSLGESGREPMHAICRNYKGYSEEECNEKYDACLDSTQSAKNPVTIATVFQILGKTIPKPVAKQLAKKYHGSHAVGKGEEIEQGELAGLVRFRLFLFTPKVNKQGEIVDLQLTRLNLNAFEKLLAEMGFYRHERIFVYVRENIVESVDVSTILYHVTRRVEQDGDYVFTYKEVEYKFSWEDVAHKWREIRAKSDTYNQVVASLPYWEPKLLKDTSTTSYVPYKNGVAIVEASGIKLVPYSQVSGQIWRERILPRNFKFDKTRGMFEDFFANVCGRGATLAERLKSEEYRRAVWYYGYMLQGTKRMSTARAWLLYDIRTGNNGRSGKTIIGTALGHIRSVALIDGKRVDITDRFAFQNVKPWTDIIVIDDPDKRMSLNPLFNMISGTTQADRKNVDPVEKPLKIAVLSNWILEMSGDSETGRQFVSQLSDFYAEYAKAKKTITPIVDLHGKEFYTDWSEQDWNRFDSFSLRCLQTHLAVKPPENTVIGSAAQLRFIQLYEEELFYALAVALKANARDTDSGFNVSQYVLTSVVKDHSPDFRKPGIVVKEFLRAMGADKISNTTIRPAGNATPVMAWAVGKKVAELNWKGIKI